MPVTCLHGLYLSDRLTFVSAEDEIDDSLDSTTDEAVVSEEGVVKAEEEDDASDGKLSASPDAETTILFTKPSGTSNLGEFIYYSTF